MELLNRYLILEAKSTYLYDVRKEWFVKMDWYW